MSPIERYAMKFVEDTGANWAAVQIRAVEMEIEQQKREWEEKRLQQKQQEELEKQRTDKEDNEMLTYSREDAMNKVNMKSKMKSQFLGKRKLENRSPKISISMQGKKSNGMEIISNGMLKPGENNRKMLRRLSKNFESPTRRNTRKAVSLSQTEEHSSSEGTKIRSLSSVINRGTSRKSDRSTSLQSRKSHTRSTSESTTRSTADSISQRTATTNNTPDESDSECSLDVMIDSNDVNDSDSNSNQNANHSKARTHFDSTSQEDDTLLNDDSTMTDETTIENISHPFKDSMEGNKVTSSPRTRSRGTVNVNLWTLDESPILPSKRHKSLIQKCSSDVPTTKQEKDLKANFGVKECKVSVVDINSKQLKPPDIKMIRPSPKSKPKKFLPSKSNHSFDLWLKKPLPKPISSESKSSSEKNETEEERIPITRQRRHTILHKTL